MVLLTALAVAGTALNVLGSFKKGADAKTASKRQAQAARENAEANRQVAYYKAGIAQNNAKIATFYGAYNAVVARNNALYSRQSAALVQYYGEYNARLSQQAAEQARSRANLARKNVALKKHQQGLIREQAGRRVEQRKIETRQLVGQQRSALAANGVVVDQDSAARIVASSREIGRQDQVQILADAEEIIFDLEIEAVNYGAEASFLEQTAVNYDSEGGARRFEAAVRSYGLFKEAADFDQESVFAMYQASVQEHNFENEAELLKLQGDFGVQAGELQATNYLAAGQAAQTQGILSGVGSLLGGASQVAQKWSTYKGSGS